MNEIYLSAFIGKVGDDVAGKLFGVTPRAAQSWRLHDREPSPEKARLIVKKTSRHKLGRVTFYGIYSDDAISQDKLK